MLILYYTVFLNKSIIIFIFTIEFGTVFKYALSIGLPLMTRLETRLDATFTRTLHRKTTLTRHFFSSVA